MLEIDLDNKLEEILEFYANKDGVSKSALARKAIAEYLEDREDYDIAVEASRNAGPGPHISLEELIHKYGLEDQLREGGGEAVRQAQSRDAGSDRELPISASRRSA
jgi:RHH-type rel operon transcriptional repressor/antitoxin RelB